MTKKAQETERQPSEFGTHVKAAGSAVVNQWKSLIPKDFWAYGREAKRESLLAVRSLIDGAINKLEAAGERAPRKAPRSKTKIEVEQA